MKPLLLLLLLLLAAPKEPDVTAPGDVFERLGKPTRDDWRWRFPEKGQTFAEYRAAKPTRPTAARARIYIRPFLTRIPRDRALLDQIEAALAAFYGREVRRLPQGALPAGAYDRRRRQVDVARLIVPLVKQLPKDALFLLAVTDRDLFVSDLEHVFGWGSMKHRVGVMSLMRVTEGADDQVWRERTVMLALHECGHMLSLPHCTFFGCLMNGVRTTADADRRPTLLCPVCRAKVRWNLGFDHARRYRALESTYRRIGLAEAASAARRAANVTLETKKG